MASRSGTGCGPFRKAAAVLQAAASRPSGCMYRVANKIKDTYTSSSGAKPGPRRAMPCARTPAKPAGGTLVGPESQTDAREARFLYTERRGRSGGRGKTWLSRREVERGRWALVRIFLLSILFFHAPSLDMGSKRVVQETGKNHIKRENQLPPR